MFKIKAGSMQLVTFIVVVVALLLSVFILLIHTQKLYKTKSDLLINNIKRIDSGMLYGISNNLYSKDTITVYQNDYESLKLKVVQWGVYKKINALSVLKKHKKIKAAIIGAKRGDNNTALFLKEKNKPLVVVGKTKIEGNVYLPKRGIKSGNIAGESYNANRLIYGKIEDIKHFPVLPLQLRDYINHIDEIYREDNKTSYFSLDNGSEVINSFESPVKFFSSVEPIYLSETILTGHIVIQSNSKIIVGATSKIKDVILIAPKIEIEDGVKGRFQAFATNSIDVGKNCILDYPSVLVLNNGVLHDSNKTTNRLIVNSNTTLKGVIAVLGQNHEKNYEAQLQVKRLVTIYGEVYSENNLELKGSVYGTVYADQFVTIANGSHYQNHIYNANILAEDLSEEFVGLPFINSKKGVAKWLY